MGCAESSEINKSQKTIEYLEKLQREWDRKQKNDRLMQATFQNPSLNRGGASYIERDPVVTNSLMNSRSSAATRLVSKEAFKVADGKVLRNMKDHGIVSVDDVYQQLSRFQQACEVVEAYFPGARNSKTILSKADKILTRHNINAKNTLYAQSICPDEINHFKGDITNLFTHYFGEVFHLGGLAGIPFTGTTGFDAFAHHVPDSKCLISCSAPF